MITILEDKITITLNKIATKAKDTGPLMNLISQNMVEAVRENITTQGRSLGKTWPAESPLTRAMKKGGKGQLRNSDRLINTLFATYSNSEAAAASPLVYAALMHFGGEVKAKKILGSVKRKKDVYAMEQYFWRMWYVTNKKEKAFKIMALHVSKYGKFTVKARPFMALGPNHIKDIKEIITDYFTD